MDSTSCKESVEKLGNRVRPQMEQVKRDVGRLNSRFTGFLQSHPAFCLMGALGLGYLVARVARNQS